MEPGAVPPILPSPARDEPRAAPGNDAAAPAHPYAGGSPPPHPRRHSGPSRAWVPVLLLVALVVVTVLLVLLVGYPRASPASSTSTGPTQSGPGVSLAAGPSTVPVNGTMYLNVTVRGLAPPLTYSYQGLPPGCPSANTSSLRCVPDRSGTYPSISVTVTAANGTSYQSLPVRVVVTAGPTYPTSANGSSPALGSGILLPLLLAIALMVVLVSAVAARRVRRGSEGTATARPAPPAPAPRPGPRPAPVTPQEEDPLDHLL